MAKPGKIEDLDCELSATDGIRLILTSRYSEMVGFKDAALSFKNPDGVHDMRVASRRLRSVLKDFRPFLRKDPLRGIEEGVTRIADTLGMVRDQDVLINTLEKLLSRAPGDVAGGI